MKVQKWYWRNGEIIGYLDEKGNEVKVTLETIKDTELHELYHKEQRRKDGQFNERV